MFFVSQSRTSHLVPQKGRRATGHHPTDLKKPTLEKRTILLASARPKVGKVTPSQNIDDLVHDTSHPRKT